MLRCCTIRALQSRCLLVRGGLREKSSDAAAVPLNSKEDALTTNSKGPPEAEEEVEITGAAELYGPSRVMLVREVRVDLEW